MVKAKMVAQESDCFPPHPSNSVPDQTPVVHSAAAAFNDSVTVESEDVCYTN